MGKVDFSHTLLTNAALPVTARLDQMSGKQEVRRQSIKVTQWEAISSGIEDRPVLASPTAGPLGPRS
jgi:hypothetical protein